MQEVMKIEGSSKVLVLAEAGELEALEADRRRLSAIRGLVAGAEPEELTPISAKPAKQIRPIRRHRPIRQTKPAKKAEPKADAPAEPRRCAICNEPIKHKGTGRIPKTCPGKCRRAYHAAEAKRRHYAKNPSGRNRATIPSVSKAERLAMIKAAAGRLDPERRIVAQAEALSREEEG